MRLERLVRRINKAAQEAAQTADADILLHERDRKTLKEWSEQGSNLTRLAKAPLVLLIGCLSAATEGALVCTREIPRAIAAIASDKSSSKW